MLALTSPINNNLHSTYSSGLAPGVQFALDLTDNNAGMSEQEGFLFSRAQDNATLRPLAENSSPFSYQRQVLARGKYSNTIDTVYVAGLHNGRRPTTTLLQGSLADAYLLIDQKGCGKGCHRKYMARLVCPRQQLLGILTGHCLSYHSRLPSHPTQAHISNMVHHQGRIPRTRISRLGDKARTALSFKRDLPQVRATQTLIWRPRTDVLPSLVELLPDITHDGGLSIRTSLTDLLNSSLCQCHSKSTPDLKLCPHYPYTLTPTSRTSLPYVLMIHYLDVRSILWPNISFPYL